MKKVFLFSFCLAGLFMYSCSKVGGGMGFEGDEYNEHGESPFYDVSDHPISTFSIDADGASYANVRSYLLNGIKAPQAAVRTEEMLNYFDLDYPYEGPHPFSVNTELSDCPWNEENKLLRIGLKGKPMATSERLPANFVFLIDVSGSMKADDKLELLKDGFKTFVDQIEAKDRISIVTYSGKVKTALEPTPGSQKETIKKAIDKLKASGGTAGGQAIQDAYALAEMNYVPNGNNRIILGTDGDFNIGISDEDELVELIEEKRKSGVYLTV